MYNKLTLLNESEPFTVKFDGTEHTVPHGAFEAEQTLGNFIFAQANKWNLKVTITDRPEAPSVKQIKENAIKGILAPTQPVVENLELKAEIEEELPLKKKK